MAKMRTTILVKQACSTHSSVKLGTKDHHLNHEREYPSLASITAKSLQANIKIIIFISRYLNPPSFNISPTNQILHSYHYINLYIHVSFGPNNIINDISDTTRHSFSYLDLKNSYHVKHVDTYLKNVYSCLTLV